MHKLHLRNNESNNRDIAALGPSLNRKHYESHECVLVMIPDLSTARPTYTHLYLWTKYFCDQFICPTNDTGGRPLHSLNRIYNKVQTPNSHLKSSHGMLPYISKRENRTRAYGLSSLPLPLHIKLTKASPFNSFKHIPYNYYS